MFGTVGMSTGVSGELLSAYRATWGEVGSVTVGSVRLGGHAFRGRSALVRHELGGAVVVDGEHSIYRDLERGRRPFVLQGGRLSTGPKTRGNVAVAEPREERLHLATEPSGLFPLYYARRSGGLALASHLRPLAEALGYVDLNPVGLTIFLHGAYYVGERTLFRDIRRLLPGQSLTFRTRESSVEIRERSRLWSSQDSERSASRSMSDEDAAESAWEHLTRATAQATEGASRAGIFLSAGGDSRTLLAAARGTEAAELSAYSHGDPASQEIGLATQVRETAGAQGRTLALGEDLFELEFLDSLFRRSECLLFPYWARTARAVEADGGSLAMAVIYGEVLGGHYGPTAQRGGVRRVGDVLARLLPLGRLRYELFPPPSREAVLTEVGGKLATRPWCLDDEMWNSPPALDEEIRAVITGEFRRLAKREMPNGDALTEAFMTEYHGAQYIGAQLRTSRCALDTAAPFAHREALSFAAALPMEQKMHNPMNRRILRRHALHLLASRLSATLVPASAPILVQEASRFLRKTGEAVRWRGHRLTGGAIDSPRTSWINFEFLRKVEADDWEGSLHPLVHQLLKMLTVEWMVR